LLQENTTNIAGTTMWVEDMDQLLQAAEYSKKEGRNSSAFDFVLWKSIHQDLYEFSSWQPALFTKLANYLSGSLTDEKDQIKIVEVRIPFSFVC